MHAIARKLVSIDLPGVGLDAGDAAVATAAEAAGAGLEGRRLDLGFGYGPGASARPVEAAPHHPRWRPTQGDDARHAPDVPGDDERGTPGIGVTSVPRNYVSYVDGLLQGTKWNATTITYSLPDSVFDYQPGYPGDDLNGFSGVGAHQTYAIHAALGIEAYVPGLLGAYGFSIEGFTNLNVDFAGYGNGAGTLRFGNNTNSNTAYGYYPAANDTGGDIWFGPSGQAPVSGNYDYHTVLHEIGHALGLKHGHEDWGYGKLPLDTDSMEYSVMTYRSYEGGGLGGYSNEDWGYAQSYMMYDIAALQHMYGADFGINSGDTRYSWDPTNGRTYVNGQLAINPGGNRIFQTIWDGGGNDTYDLSNYATDLEINLTPGYHNVFDRAQLAYLGGGPNGGYARGNVFNALQYKGDDRSLIENAFGGSGDDDIIGNATANWLVGNAGDDDLVGFGGDDWLEGGDGNDWIDGGQGADVMIGGAGDDFYYVDNVGDVTLEPFDAGGVDTVAAYVSHELGQGLDNLTIIGAGSLSGTGNELANRITGNSSANALYGLGGADRLDGGDGGDLLYGALGSDTLVGGLGDDLLMGGTGADVLRGGAGVDTLVGGVGDDVFDFDLATESRPGARDVLVEEIGVAVAFQGAGVAGGDRIDLAGIDADTTRGGNQAFHLGGGAAVGRLTAVNVNGDTIIRGNTDGDAAFEFELRIAGGGVLAADYRAFDFVL
ncbi:M10 family metallopeptidase C-terminal domain-containing protein [Amaricoccus sp.]|uniref:M10 family metallopeptidase n=1 Tax=Amaricoccus sp. TaxID=1872485 RepID=UPI001B447053|nr:M10 family metallopeptidase C-terminal domain-containing protein [Amaricoccus sp.]MBP7241446.1 M10 family metallopeptidase C-terminal domain-containing protein [Amaricoccus sp.]